MNKFFITITALVLNLTLFSVAFADTTEDDVKKAVIAVLKDPDSARFGEVTQVAKDKFCVTINAKNSMGGYTGNQESMVIKLNGAWQSLGSDSITKELCAQAIIAITQ